MRDDRAEIERQVDALLQSIDRGEWRAKVPDGYMTRQDLEEIVASSRAQVIAFMRKTLRRHLEAAVPITTVEQSRAMLEAARDEILQFVDELAAKQRRELDERRLMNRPLGGTTPGGTE